VANKGVFLENPHTIRTLKTAPTIDRDWELRNAFLTALVRFARDAVQALWERRTLPPAEHLAQCKAWCEDFRLTDGGKEIPKWLLDHATLALHLWHRGEGHADWLGWTGFDLLGYYDVGRNPEWGFAEKWAPEPEPEPKRRGRPRDNERDWMVCQLVILNQVRRIPVAAIAEVMMGKHVSTGKGFSWPSKLQMELLPRVVEPNQTKIRSILRRVPPYVGDSLLWIDHQVVYCDREPNGLRKATWPKGFMSESSVRVAIAEGKRALGFASKYGAGRPRKAIRSHPRKATRTR
jgi:hypothetical protein